MKNLLFLSVFFLSLPAFAEIENIYIADYYLSMPDETARFKVLDFLGGGNKKIEFFKKHKQMIMEKKNNV